MRLILVSLLSLFVLTGCDQNGLGAAQAVKNFFMTPVDAVKSIFTNSSYNKEKSKHQKQEEQTGTGEINYCVDQQGKILSNRDLKTMSDLGAQIRSAACQCMPWGSCPKDVCACEIQCPQGFDIFQHPAGTTAKSLSTVQNGLAFRNGGGDSQYESTQGYCWGHARTTSQFNRLAFFKPDSIPPYSLKSTQADEQTKAIDYYKKLIDDIVDNKATDIPGFSNLQEFSDHPALQSYIADKVAISWASQAMSWQGLSTTVDGSKKSNKTYNKLFSDVKERVDMNMQPTIIFTERKSPFVTHALLVSHYETLPGGQLKLCLRDNNNPESYAATCADNMTIDENRGLMYNNAYWGEIGSAKIAHNENADAVAQASSLRKKCQSEKGCQKE